MIEVQLYTSPLGELIIGSFEGALVMCDWKHRKMRTAINKRIQTALQADFKEGDSTIIQQTIIQLEEYFAENRKEFNLPIRLVGTDFQRSVWKALQEIPFGKTDTYLGLSKKLKRVVSF